MIKILLTAFILATISIKYAEFVQSNLPGYFDFYKLFHNFNVCFKTSNVLYIDDDDDANFNTLQLYQNDNMYHEINLKNNKNIFIYSEGGIFFMAECKKIKAINIPKQVKFCVKFLFVRYYLESSFEPVTGYLQPNLIIRNDANTFSDIQKCVSRKNFYNIGNLTLSQSGNGSSKNYSEFINKANETTSFSLKKLSQIRNFIDYF